MSDTIMAEEVKPQEKVAFASRKYSNEDRIKKEDTRPNCHESNVFMAGD